eukprot:6129605-Prymnesium_polylepis.1
MQCEHNLANTSTPPFHTSPHLSHLSHLYPSLTCLTPRSRPFCCGAGQGPQGTLAVAAPDRPRAHDVLHGARAARHRRGRGGGGVRE